MGREIRYVTADWKHPTDERGHEIPLFDGATLAERTARWDEEAAQWAKGLRRDFGDREKWVEIEPKYRGMPFEKWDGDRPDPADYTPPFPDGERTHMQMYETTTEGTPISPVFPRGADEEMARWLADNGASWFGGEGASMQAWLDFIKGLRGDAGMLVMVARR